ncbi:MAG: putative baseplate assembly protein [Alphaproteobacteria bacterium]|nr:putative baseplate assembly protein [Alphaproteobacteria bacterium]
MTRPLKPPVLDDRTYTEIRDELIRRIPAHAPHWTHRGPTDPGIALLELFAWLTDNTLYRLNRVPEASHLEFLRLLGRPLEPASVAQGLVRLSLRRPEDGAVLLPFAANKPGVVVAAGDEEFELTHEIRVQPVEVRAAVKWPVDATPDHEPLAEDEITEMVKWVRERFELGEVGGDPYETRMLEDGAAGLPEPTRLATAIDHTLWLAVLAPEAPAEPRAIEGAELTIGFVVDDRLCGADEHRHCDSADAALPPIEWSVATGRFHPRSTGGPDLTRPIFLPLTVVEDSTAGLSRTGRVVFRLPGTPSESTEAPAFGTWTADDLGDEDLLGVGALPPPLDDEPAARVVTWIRARRADGPHAAVRWVAANVAEARHARVARGERIGEATGRAHQEYRVSRAPVLRESLTVRVGADPTAPAWTEVEDLAHSGPTDPHYTLDPRTGTVRFGDDLNGQAPRLGASVFVASYRHGGGASGNASARAITQLRTDHPVTVENPFAFTGGRDSETVPVATRRLAGDLRHRERAVAAQDFVDLATRVPGVGRAWVLPRHLPYERLDDIPGVVTVVVLPEYDPLTPNRPTPDRTLLQRVCADLDERRLVTTELYVSPPEYVPVWVSASIQIEPGYGEATVLRWVDLAVRQHLAPLPPYGPEQAGWPNGRDIWEADIHAAILRVEGVRLVNDVALAGTEIAADGSAVQVPEEGGLARVVRLHTWQIPTVEAVFLATGDTGAEAPAIVRQPDERVDPGGPGSLPLPTRREPC